MEQVRLAQKEDAATIALLGRTTFKETFCHLFHNHADLQAYLGATFSVNKIKQSLEKKNNVFWLALIDELPVGYAKLKVVSGSSFIVSQHVSQLQKIYVLQDFLSLKMGKRLQDTLLEKARMEGSEHLWLSVYRDNKRAIRFYEKNDFRTVGSHQFDIGSQTFDFLVMAKSLNSYPTT